MKLFFMLWPAILLLAGCQLFENNSSRSMERVNEYEHGRLKYQQGKYIDATQSQTQWLQKYPQDEKAYIHRGQAYSKLRKHEEALNDFAQARKLAPSSLVPRVYECGELAKLGRQQEALNLSVEIMSHPGFINLNPYEKFLLYSIDGQLRIGMDDREGAISSLNRAIQVYNNHTSTFINRGSPYIHRIVLYNRAVVHNKLGYFELAATDMESYITISQQARQEISSRDYAKLALAYFMSEQYEKCKAILPLVSVEDRRMLAETLNEDFFYRR